MKRLLVLSLAACGGPAVQYDPAPAPRWLQETADVKGANIFAVGMAPATVDSARDLDMATRDAKTKVGQLFQSEVVARQSDWTMASSGGKKDSERTVTQSSVDVRTQVKVEDVEVASAYRDEATATHYVKVHVNRASWASKLDQRLSTTLGQMASQVDSARRALEAKKAMAALEALLAAAKTGREVESDVIVMDLLATNAGAGKKLVAHKNALDELGKKLRDQHAFVLQVAGPKDAATRLGADVKQFLAAYGFNVADKAKGGVVKIVVAVGEKFLSSERVADRDEKIHAATGSLKVVDADGSEIAALTIDLGDGRYTERDVDAKAAANKALLLGADTLASMFRSAFRKAYEL